MEIIQGQNIPLVLACVEEYYPIYEEVTNYKDLHDKMIAGNPDHYTEDEIMEKAQPILAENLNQDTSNFFDRFNKSESKDLLFKTIPDFRSSVKMHNIDSLLVNEAQMSNMEANEQYKITRDIAEAFQLGAKIIKINDTDNGHAILGIKRFKMKSVAS
jgi:hypothetical protein